MGRSATETERQGGEPRERYHWTEQHAREVIAELRATGEPAARFAQRKGITRQRLAYWATRIESIGPASRMPAFVQVTSVPAVTRTAAVAPPAMLATEPIEISVGVAVIRVRVSHDVEHVAQLVDAIARRMRVDLC